MDYLQILLLVAVGVVAGIINILAGGGSLLTLPVLIFLGLPPQIANGTNRIAILAQNIVAVNSFSRGGKLPLKLAMLCTPSALLGSYFGARIAVNISDELFRQILAGVLILVMIVMMFDPAKRLTFPEKQLGWLRMLALVVSFFGIGIYGGFIQAGVGFLIITALLCHGLDLVRINAVKVFVVLFFTAIALAVFIQHGQVDYKLGLALAVGNSIGGWLGTKLAIAKGHGFIRKLLFAVIVVFAIRLFWQ